MAAARGMELCFLSSFAPNRVQGVAGFRRSEEHTSELQSRLHLVCRLLLEKKKKKLETNEETIEKLGGHAESNLKHVVEFGDGAISTHHTTTPTLRTNIADANASLIELPS